MTRVENHYHFRMPSDAAERNEPRDERAERRDRRKQSERERMKKHGSRLAEIYRNSILKRLMRSKR
jgi:hypothetical protein